MDFKSTNDVVEFIARVGYYSRNFRPTGNEELFQDMVRVALGNLRSGDLFDLARIVTGTDEQDRILKIFCILHLMTFPEGSYYDPKAVIISSGYWFEDEWELRRKILDIIHTIVVIGNDRVAKIVDETQIWAAQLGRTKVRQTQGASTLLTEIRMRKMVYLGRSTKHLAYLLAANDQIPSLWWYRLLFYVLSRSSDDVFNPDEFASISRGYFATKLNVEQAVNKIAQLLDVDHRYLFVTI